MGDKNAFLVCYPEGKNWRGGVTPSGKAGFKINSIKIIEKVSSN